MTETDWRTLWEHSDFYRHAHPNDHFRTMSNLDTEFATMVYAYARTHNLTQVVEIGAGSGRLLDLLSTVDPALELYGVDQRDANGPFHWIVDKWNSRIGDWTTGSVRHLFASLQQPVLALAVEWLDDIPCTIVQRTPALRRVGPDGLGAFLPQEEAAWACHWWPTGNHLEIGLSRDRAWRQIAQLLPPGSILLMIDYGHFRSNRPLNGTFTGYLHGRQRTPGPQMNLTAHVAIDSVAAAVENAGLEPVLSAPQHTLTHLLAPQSPPERSDDPLAALAARSRRHALSAPHLFGSFWWLAHRVPTATALQRAGSSRSGQDPT